MANRIEKRGRGSDAGPTTVRATILLDPEVKEWGVRQPGGLSELVRGLMRDAYLESHGLGRTTALLAEPVLDRIWGSPEEDEAWGDL
jgi:hypothetical protein